MKTGVVTLNLENAFQRW